MRLSELHETVTELIGPKLDRLQQVALLIGLVGLALTVVGLILDLRGFFHSYLYAYLFWMGATAGCLIWLMVHHVVGGGWGYIIRRFLEAGTRLLPLMLVLFIPVVIGLLFFGLYEWAQPGAARDPVLQSKAVYLNVPFFIGRTVFYFVVWIAIAYLLNRWGAILDERDDIDAVRRLQYLSSVGIVVYSITGTFAMFDWVMSLTPHWYSTIFALLGMVGQALTGLALILVLLSVLAGDLPILREVPRGFFRDLGNLLLMLILLWGYMAFSQYLLTFTGDSVEEVSWYLQRRGGAWGALALLLIACHFFLPFMVLVVGSNIKRDPNRLAKVAAFILVMRFIDLFWWVTPTFSPYRLTGIFADIGAPLLLGGIWLWAWAWQLKQHDPVLVPLRDPRLEGLWQQVVEHG